MQSLDYKQNYSFRDWETAIAKTIILRLLSLFYYPIDDCITETPYRCDGNKGFLWVRYHIQKWYHWQSCGAAEDRHKPWISSPFFQVLSLPMVFQCPQCLDNRESMKILRLTLQLRPNCLSSWGNASAVHYQFVASASLLFCWSPSKAIKNILQSTALTHCAIDCDNCDESPTVNRLYHTLCQLLYSLLFPCFVLFSMGLLCLEFRCQNLLWC